MPHRFAEFYAPGTPPIIRPSFDSVPAALVDTALRFPTRTALDCCGKELTYAQLERRIRAAAQGLLDRGIRPGDRVSLVLPMSINAVIAFHAVLRIGAIAVQHSANTPAAQLSVLFDDYEPVAAIVCESRIEALRRIPSDALPLSVIAVQRQSRPRPLPAISLSRTVSGVRRVAGSTTRELARTFVRRTRKKSPDAADGFYVAKWKDVVTSAPLPVTHPYPARDAVATLLYNAHAGRNPLGVMLTHENLCAVAEQSQLWRDAGEPGTETSLAMWPLSSVAGLADTLTTSLLHGRRITLLPRFHKSAVDKAVKKHPPTIIGADVGVLAHLTELADEGKLDLNAVKVVVTPAAKVQAELTEKWLRHVDRLPMMIGYGLSVSCVVTAIPAGIGRSAPANQTEMSIGIPFPATQLRVVDPQHRGRVMASGAVGELMVKGSQVFHGYWRNSERTSETLTGDGWARTGHLAVMNDAGFVQVFGRVKHTPTTTVRD